MGILKRFHGNDDAPLPVPEQNAVAKIEVRDIKQYLVEEYNRSRELERTNEYLKAQLKAADEGKLKYDASLVTLDEFKLRIDELERKLKSAEKEIAEVVEARMQAEEKANELLIILNHTAREKDGIRAEVIDEIKAEIIERIKGFKGNLSKAMAIKLVEEDKGETE